jgi:TrpR-related protein YerC/YecD
MNQENRVDLYQAITRIKSEDLAKRFLEDVCSPKELDALADRLKVAKLLNEEISYRDISHQTGTSTATITRVARALNHGTNGYKDIITKKGINNALRK